MNFHVFSHFEDKHDKKIAESQSVLLKLLSCRLIIEIEHSLGLNLYLSEDIHKWTGW